MQLSISGVTVRLVFRALFTVLFFYIGILGSVCNELSKKRKLLRNGRIRVSEATGWLGLFDLVLGVWNLRCIPSPRWWLLMALVGILSKLTDFATSAVQQRYIRGTCDFGTGMVLTTNGSLPAFDTIFAISANGRPVLVAGNAQLTSIANGCNQGIYRKANNDSMFCAAGADLLGEWKCSPVGSDMTYGFQLYDPQQIVDNLIEQGLLYPKNVSYIETNSANPLAFSHLVAWSSSTFDGSGNVFSVKASVDLTPLNSDDKIMHNMNCVMSAAEAETINAAILSVSTLHWWLPYFQGYMYNGLGSPAVGNPEETLAWVLNTMIMVAGSNDYLLSKAPANDPRQGCLVLTTVVPWWLVGLLFLTVLLAILGSIAWLVLYLQVQKHSRGSLVKNAPLDLWTWMAQAILESRGVRNSPMPAILPREVKKWNIEIESTQGVRIEQEADELQSLTVDDSGPKG